MKTLLVSTALGLGLLLSAGAYAQAPAGATAQCKDGTYYSGTTHKGACRGHKGVKEWLNGGSSATANPASATKAEPAAKKSKAPAKSEAAAPVAAAAGPAPAGATAMCKDGTYFSGTTHKGACRGHKGVKEWFGSSKAEAASPAAAPAVAPAAAPTPAAKPAKTSKHTAPTPASQIAQKAGGGPGLVWVNSGSKVYHCQGDEWYGKTKQGAYMSEAAAKAAGNHASHGKDCSK